MFSMDMRVHQRCLRHSQQRQVIFQTGRPALPRRDVAGRGRCRTTAVVYAKAKAATVAQPQQSAPAAAVHAAALPPAVTYAVTASTVYAGVLLLAMILLPRLPAVRKAMQSYWWSLPLALVYLALLVYSWTPNHISTLLPGSLTEGLAGGFNPQFFPRLDAISALFSQPATAASLLLHILAINLFLGRSIYLDGLAKGIPTAHSLIVAATLGPLGLITHWITKAVFFATPGLRPDSKQQVLKDGNGGSIIIMPYEL